MNTMNWRMPPEWEQHEGTIIQWPVTKSLVWPENEEEVKASYRQVVLEISKFEKVWLIVNEEDYKLLDGTFNEYVTLITIPHDDAWARDSGPTFVYDDEGQLHGLSWSFNAWGEKYTPYDKDNALAGTFLSLTNYEAQCVDMVLEGGSFHVDGVGTLLSTEECLLNPNRNPSLNKESIEATLKKYLGVTTFVWLKNGLFGDETDGHIDNIACFAKEGTVLIQTCKDKTDPNYQITENSLEILRNTKDAKGKPFEIIEIPQPPIRYYKGERLTLSYLNFYIVNGGILLPIFGGDASSSDQVAIDILEQVFKDRVVVPINGMGLIKEGGNIHCITQQIPAQGGKA